MFHGFSGHLRLWQIRLKQNLSRGAGASSIASPVVDSQSFGHRTPVKRGFLKDQGNKKETWWLKTLTCLRLAVFHQEEKMLLKA